MSVIKGARRLIDMRRNVRRDPDALAQLQAAKLRHLLRHAGTRVPYYRNLFRDAGIRPSEIRTAGDLATLPVTTRAMLQSVPPVARLAEGIAPDQCLKVATSGSSGDPLITYFSPEDDFIRSVVMVRAFMELGYRPADKYSLIRLGRQEDEPTRWFQRLGLFRVLILYALDDVDEILQQLIAYQPALLAAYPSMLSLLASRLNGRQPALQPRLICAAGEILTGATRRYISQAFGVPVRNIYSAVECGNIAFECEYGALHLNTDSLVVEVVKDGRPAQPGETGEIRITTLDLWSAPLIRYPLGDRVTLGNGRCRCGRTLPWLRKIVGRTTDLVRLQNGRTTTGTAFGVALFKDLTAVRQYRIIQETPQQFHIEVVPAPSYSQATATAIEQRLHQMAGTGVEVHLQCVPDIPREANGKWRSVVSRVAPRLDEEGE